mmetsp:Transcript_10038/g.35308  ORF Transcript_10038/g.35308 Transcript_10038/m.35308 type:complete len:226 (-) Transcript_10038:328-1005(-)
MSSMPSAATMEGKTPSLSRMCWTSALLARFAIARDASPLVLTSSVSASATSGASPRSSRRRPCSSASSTRLATQQQACRSVSMSPDKSMAMIVEMDRSQISILFSSTDDKQFSAAATSRSTSISSVRAINTMGSKMPSCTAKGRNCGEIQSPRSAAMACRWALASSQQARATSAATPPSSTICWRWFALAAKLDSANAAYLPDSMSSVFKSAINAAMPSVLTISS